jgi:tRNA U34 5-methylaminomethyl-2-thiouridine-forming methyltransferase MnmC
MKFEIKHTADGSATIFLPGLNEQYHSMNGAVTESRHVFVDMGVRFHSSPSPSVFEVGFGTGLNALVTAAEAETTKRATDYIAIDSYPLDLELLKRLDYSRFIPVLSKDFYISMHECDWETPVQLTPYFRLHKIKLNLINDEIKVPGKFDIIYFDAFGPDKQPEMWTQQIFTKIYDLTLPGGVLVTYSAKGEVRRRLTTAGFKTERLPGPPGKKEMLRAIK